MSLKIQLGDLLKIEHGIVMHQVNCDGLTGGLAGALRRKHPKAFDDYLSACGAFGQANIGSSLLCRATPTLQIAHVFGQIHPGATTSLSGVDCALQHLSDVIAASDCAETPTYAPYLMGCGLGGGRWAEYEPIIAKHFPSVTIIKLPS